MRRATENAVIRRERFDRTRVFRQSASRVRVERRAKLVSSPRARRSLCKARRSPRLEFPLRPHPSRDGPNPRTASATSLCRACERACCESSCRHFTGLLGKIRRNLRQVPGQHFTGSAQVSEELAILEADRPLYAPYSGVVIKNLFLLRGLKVCGKS